MERFQRKLKSLSDKRTSQKDIVIKLETALEKVGHALLVNIDVNRLVLFCVDSKRFSNLKKIVL